MPERIARRELLTGALAAGVSLALPACGGSAVVESAATRATRRTRVTGPGRRTLRQVIRGHVFERGSPGFVRVAHIYNELFDRELPHAVARPVSEADVRAAVQWAVGRGEGLRARSGGHSYAGYSTLSDGVVLDLRNLNRISVDRRAGTATIGAGAQLIDVYSGLSRHGATIPGGSCPSVGITGVTLGGGMGLAGRAFGLTADHLVGAHIVTADGRLRKVDRHTDPDLLWALRGGGGGNFGVVTQLKFKVRRAPANAAYFFASWPWSQASAALDAWQHWAPHTTEKLTSIFHLENDGGPTAVSADGQYLGSAGDLGHLLAPLRDIPGATVSTGTRGYLPLQMLWAGCAHTSLRSCHTTGAAPGGTLQRASFRAKSDYVGRPLSGQARATLISAIERRGSESGTGAILFDAYGGAINRVHSGATAFVHRDELFCMQYLTYDGGGSWLTDTHDRMRRHVSGFAYQNYIDAALRRWQHAYYGANYRRLERIRREVDPHHFFAFPQAIGR